MKFIRFIGVIVGVVVAGFLITAAFVKKDYAVERTIMIDKPVKEVFGFLKFLKNQDKFSVWARKDPNMKKTFKGTDAQPGFVSAWESQLKDVGKGEQEILKITEGERIDYELRFIEPFEAKDKAYIKTDAASKNVTQVVWGFAGQMNYPKNIMLLFIDMEKMLGGELYTGLQNLKQELEKK